MNELEGRLHTMIEMCDEAEEEAAKAGNPDAQVKLCGTWIYTGYVRRMISFLADGNRALSRT